MAISANARVLSNARSATYGCFKATRYLITHSQLDGILEPLSERGYPLPVRTPTYVETPIAVSKFVRKLPKYAGPLERVTMDRVLSRELFENSRR